YAATMDSGWGGWDVTVARGPWDRARILVGAENHGGTKRLYRLRCMPVLSGLARAGLGLLAVGAALLMTGHPIAGLACAVAGAGAGAGIACQLNGFSMRMRRLIDQAAGAAGLTPLDRVGRDRMPTGAPRMA
ncbi:MAG TPA: hypothetical protein VFW46_08090, partial [Stellaceae bacterium]|nr:hypothetical protein [Stellaceae bacterium]